MPKSRRLSRLWERRSWSVRQSLPIISKRLTAGLRSIITPKTDQHGLEMPRSESEDESRSESHEADNHFTLDTDIARTTPDAGEDSDAGDGANNGHDHDEADHQVKTKAPGSARSVPSSSAQDKRERSGEHHHLAPVNAGYKREHETPAPSDISRKPSTKKEQDIIEWVNRQPGTAHLPDHDADMEQPPVFPPSRSGTGDLNNDALSVINEHASSASGFSREASPQESTTSATTRDDPLGLDQTTQGISDDDDTMSDVTDHTDLSLREAFDASPTPFGPVLLSLLITLKEEVVDRIRRRLQTMILQQRPMQHNRPGPSSSASPSGNADNIPPTTSLPTRRKRALDDDDGSNPGRRGDNDGEKRKRKDPTSTAQVEESLRKFACPFYKRYPASEKLYKSCHGPGWGSVHRVKEHVYRRHQTPTAQCVRCQVSFANQAALTEHLRAERQCENKTPSPDEEIIYITQDQERELRKKRKNVPEEDRWFENFRIIFPNLPDDQLPSSAYHETHQEPLPDSAVLSAFRAFLLQELPLRIAADVDNHLQIRPAGISISGDMGVARAIEATILEVVDEFSPILAPSTATAAANPAASGLHMGPTIDWPLGGTTTRVSGPLVPFTNNNMHTIHPFHTPPPPPVPQPGRHPSMFTNPPPTADTPPFHPSPPPPRVPGPPPAPWEPGPVFASPASSTLDFGQLQLQHYHQYAGPDGAAGAHAPARGYQKGSVSGIDIMYNLARLLPPLEADEVRQLLEILADVMALRRGEV
ncbi:hypothetical protein C8A05DRAFT_37168 [Staphylotrichum tortipilum]|uniref:C2H2-type domain-containing protein n=1 Tax=Staphylotrichum tortipilum TaxID=2831512 RepID=A0AAN6ME97_9PEZI|nr:hypothetical protein C8A05DRAFT_37168 [Staphylotrichum longicolle]